MKKIFLLTLAIIGMCNLHANENLLDNVNITWRHVLANGSKGEVQKSNTSNSYEINKQNKDGHIFFLPAKDVAITPGKRYKVKVDFIAHDDNINAHMMVSMPGSLRTPFPLGNKVALGKGKKSSELTFEANDDEKLLRITTVINGTGKMSIVGVYFYEIPLEENILKQNELKWYSIGLQGATGTLKQNKNGEFDINKTNNNGTYVFTNRELLKLKKDKTYQIIAQYDSKSKDTDVYLMVSMPGGSRTPFPTSNISRKIGENTLEMSFKAKFDEKFLKIHVCLRGAKGEIVLKELTCKEVDPVALAKKKIVNELNLDADLLESKFSLHRALSCENKDKNLMLQINAMGGIFCNYLNWNAKDIKMVEVDFSAQGGEGYLRLDFIAEYNNKIYKSYLNMSAFADGKTETLQFPVAEDAAWRGTIKSIKFSWDSRSLAEIAFSRVAALNENNIIANANMIKKDKTYNISMIKPRGIYTLSYKKKNHKGGKIEFFNKDNAKISEVILEKNSNEIKFVVPQFTMVANFSANQDSCAENYPVLQLNDLPNIDNPPAYWRGSWIWSQNNFGPDNTNVWFQKNITLSSKVKRALFVGAGDDVFELFVNGKSIGGGKKWNTPEKFDISKFLKVGENTIIVRTYNYQAWGGLLAEVYIKTIDDKELFICSDGDWNMHVGGTTIPKQFNKKPMVLGMPPISPWGKQVGYKYIGDIGEIEIINCTEDYFEAKILNVVKVKSSSLMFKTIANNGETIIVKGNINPATDKWKKNEIVKVFYKLPPVYEKRNNDKIFLASEFVDVKDNRPVGKLKKINDTPTKFAQSTIINSGFRPFIQINNQEKLVPIYYDMPGTYKDVPNDKDFLLKNASNAGVDFIRFDFSIADSWKEEGKYDFSNLDRLMQVFELSTNDEKAILALKINAPEWWLNKYKDNLTAYYQQKPRHPQKDCQALASKKWIEDMSVVLKEFIKYVKTKPYAHKIIGLVISEGWNSEWFWSYVDGNGKAAMSGYSPSDIATFKNILRKKYKTNLALQKAYNNANLTFDNIQMPTPERINESSIGTLLDPAKDQDIIDYFEFRNVAVADAIEAFATVIKNECDNKLLVGVYYGYMVAFSNIYNRLQTVGHLGVNQISTSKVIDFVVAPSFYTWRRLGMGDGVMQIADAFSLNGKLVIVEQDIRTYSQDGHYEARNGKVYTVAQSIGVMNRALAMLLTRGLGMHYMEMNETWFKEPVLLDVIKEQIIMYKKLPPLQGSVPNEVCIVSCDKSPMYVKHNQGDGVHQGLIAGLLSRINQSGFAFRHVLLSDILEENIVKPKKFYIITNLIKLTPEEHQKLTERFKKEKATVLYLYGAGITDGETTPTAENISKLLGIELKMELEPYQIEANFKSDWGIKKFKNINATSPNFFPIKGFSEVIATDNNNEPVLVSWEKNKVKYYFTSLTMLPPEVLSKIAKKSGVWLYGDNQDQIYAGNDIICLYARKSGIKKINIPKGYKLTPIFGPHSKELSFGETFNAEVGQTYGFLLKK